MRHPGASQSPRGSQQPANARPSPPSVSCDLCESTFTLPAEIAAQGVIHGLLTCSQCIEDSLFAHHLENQP